MAKRHELDSLRRSVEELKQDIDALSELQEAALKRATYVGMTPDDAKVLEERRKKITSLVNQLAKLKASESGKRTDGEEKPSTTLPGVVQKVIPSPHPSVPEKAEIEVKGADDLYREIRVDNVLTDKDGGTVRLKRGAEVDVTIEADEEDTAKQRETEKDES